MLCAVPSTVDSTPAALPNIAEHHAVARAALARPVASHVGQSLMQHPTQAGQAATAVKLLRLRLSYVQSSTALLKKEVQPTQISSLSD